MALDDELSTVACTGACEQLALRARLSSCGGGGGDKGYSLILSSYGTGSTKIYGPAYLRILRAYLRILRACARAYQTR